MNDLGLILTIVVIILIIYTYKLFWNKPNEEALSGSNKRNVSGSNVTKMQKYLNRRLREIRSELDQSEGFMQALSGVSHIAEVDEKIRESDERFTELKNEEHEILQMLNRKD